MSKERTTKHDQQEKTKQPTGNKPQPHQPINPFKEPAHETPETPQEEARTEQQRKEAMTERD